MRHPQHVYLVIAFKVEKLRSILIQKVVRDHQAAVVFAQHQIVRIRIPSQAHRVFCKLRKPNRLSMQTAKSSRCGAVAKDLRTIVQPTPVK